MAQTEDSQRGLDDVLSVHVHSGHEWLQVGNRRWCLGCDAYQSRRDERATTPWRPGISAVCPRYTPYARAQDGSVAT